MGGGAAFFDYDNDGWIDIFLVNGTSFDPEGPRQRRPTSYLFHNNRDGTFTDVTKKAGLTHSGWGQGCCVGDYDNDGFDDLFVTCWGRNVLYHNNGDGTFTDVSEKAGVAGSGTRWGAGCCFIDYDRDGRLDLFVANYVNFDPAKAPLPGRTATAAITRFRCRAVRSATREARTSSIATAETGPSKTSRKRRALPGPAGRRPWCSSPATGGRSARMGWEQRPRTSTTTAGRTSTSPATPRRACSIATTTTGRSARSRSPAGTAFDEHGAALAGMGVGVGDYDADGWLDIVRTNFSEQVTILYRNYGGAFEDASIKAGLGVNRKYVGFGVDFLDFDNDGWSDIFIANGHVYSQIAGRKLHLSYRQPRLLYRNLGNGRFRDVSSEAGPAMTRGESRPRMCLRRLRQRRRCRRAHQQPRWPADAAPERRRQQEQLDPHQVRGYQIEPVRDRYAGEGDGRRPYARWTR